MPNSHKRRKGSYLTESSTERPEAVLSGQLYRDRLQRENKLGACEDRKSQRMKGATVPTDMNRQTALWIHTILYYSALKQGCFDKYQMCMCLDII